MYTRKGARAINVQTLISFLLKLFKAKQLPPFRRHTSQTARKVYYYMYIYIFTDAVLYGYDQIITPSRQTASALIGILKI